MYARTRGSPGAVTAMFTFHNADTLSKVQESDLEIRTNDPVEYIQYTNQPSWNEDGSISQATRNVSLSAKLGWSDWQYHRMDVSEYSLFSSTSVHETYNRISSQARNIYFFLAT